MHVHPVIATVVLLFMIIMQAEVQSTLISKEAWSKLEDVGSSQLNSFIAQSSKNSGAAVSNIWSPRKRSPKKFGVRNDLTESQLPTLDAFKIVPYPALDSQLLQIIFSPKTLLDKMAKNVKDANDASNLFEMPKKIADDNIEISGIAPDIVAEEVNIVETPKIVTEELSAEKPPTKYDEIIKIIDAEPTVIDVVESIEIPKAILIEEAKINPTHNEDAKIITETKISSKLNPPILRIDNIEGETSTADLQSPPEVNTNDDNFESSVIVGNPSNLLINESSEIMKKVAEMPDANVAIDDCECLDCDNTASEVEDLEMASNEVSSIQSENVAAINPIFEVETVAEIVPAPRRTRVPQTLPAVIIAETILTEKQDATEKYEEPISESSDKEPISEFADEKPIDMVVDEKAIEKLEVPKLPSDVEEQIHAEVHESIEKTSVPILSSVEEKEIEQELDELSIEEIEHPKISSAEEKQIDKEVDELSIDKTLVPRIPSESTAFSIIEPALFSKNVKRQIGDFVQPAIVNKPIFMNNLENETSSEKRERIQKSLQRLMHFVTIVGHVDSYLTKRFRNGVRTFARLCESGEDTRLLRHRRNRFSF